MKVFIVITLLVNYSCSTTNKSGEKIDDEELDALFSSISNDDFKKEPQVKYSKRNDYIYNTDKSVSSVKTESSDMLPEDILEELESGKDPLLVMVSHCKQGHYDVAVKLADTLYKKYFKHPGYWNQLGSCYYRKGDLNRARLMYNKSRVINSRYTPAVNNLGVIYQTRGREEKAFAAYKRANKLAPYALTPLLNKANVLLKYGLYNKARKIYNKLISYGPHDPVILNGLAVSEMMGGSFNKAVSLFQRLDETVVKRPEVGVNYAYSLVKVGRVSEGKTILAGIDEGSVPTPLSEYYNQVLEEIDGGK